jgi:hypothetical protein
MRKILLSFIAISVLLPLGVVRAGEVQSPGQLTAAQIVDKSVAAKGGLAGWRAVQSISFSGNMDAGGKGKDIVQLPFVLEMKRPRKMRVEIEFAKEKSVQVYDGVNGWKLRPCLGRN